MQIIAATLMTMQLPCTACPGNHSELEPQDIMIDLMICSFFQQQ